MEKILIYHNPRWGKSRESVKILVDKDVQFEVIEYLKYPINKLDLIKLIKILDINPLELIRKGEQEFKDLNLDSSQLEDINFLADCIASYPKIMQRPIIIKGNKGIIARPPEKIFDIL